MTTRNAIQEGFNGYEVPLIPGSVIGKRRWYLDEHSYGLRSLSLPGQDPWSLEPKKARCFQPRRLRIDSDLRVYAPSHDCPDMECQCGIYGYFEMSEDAYENYGLVQGAIKSWGKVIYGEKGFRAQYAQILGLVVPTDWRRNAITAIAHFAHSKKHLYEEVRNICNYARARMWPEGELNRLLSNDPFILACEKSISDHYADIRSELALQGFRLYETIEDLAKDFPISTGIETSEGLASSDL